MTVEGERQKLAGERQVNNELPAVLTNFWHFQTSGQVDPPPPTLESLVERTEDDRNASACNQEAVV